MGIGALIAAKLGNTLCVLIDFVLWIVKRNDRNTAKKKKNSVINISQNWMWYFILSQDLAILS